MRLRGDVEDRAEYGTVARRGQPREVGRRIYALQGTRRVVHVGGEAVGEVGDFGDHRVDTVDL